MIDPEVKFEEAAQPIQRYNTLAQYHALERQVYIYRSTLFVLIITVIFGFVSQNLPPLSTPASLEQIGKLFFGASLGFGFWFIWCHATMRGNWWINRLRRQMEELEGLALGEEVRVFRDAELTTPRLTFSSFLRPFQYVVTRKRERAHVLEESSSPMGNVWRSLLLFTLIMWMLMLMWGAAAATMSFVYPVASNTPLPPRMLNPERIGIAICMLGLLLSSVKVLQLSRSVQNFVREDHRTFDQPKNDFI